MRKYKQLLLANKAWSAELIDQNPEFFKRQTGGEKPDFLWIGCSDSRVSAEQMTMTPPGGMFIHHNIANLVHDDDLNLLSVLEYAVAVLAVKHVIVCGHHGCNGIRTALTPGTGGPVDHWLENARAVHRDHAQEIDGAGPLEARINRFAEVNVRDQLLHLARTDIVQRRFAGGHPLVLHGWIYDSRAGLIRQLIEIDGRTVLDELAVPDRLPA